MRKKGARMREVKYRAWVKDIGVMFPVKTLFLESNVCRLDKPYGNTDYMDDEIELMQSTGLHDKNGKEIYEGHIVKCTDGEGEINEFDSDTGIGQVEWIEKWGFWNISEVENGLGDILIIGYVEVIGNIYENPELLESEE